VEFQNFGLIEEETLAVIATFAGEQATRHRRIIASVSPTSLTRVSRKLKCNPEGIVAQN